MIEWADNDYVEIRWYDKYPKAYFGTRASAVEWLAGHQ